MLDKDIERIVLGDIAMPNEIKEKPIIPLRSKKLEEEYWKTLVTHTAKEGESQSKTFYCVKACLTIN